MTDTALDHPLVRGYLRDLDRALASLPAAQARELTEQITAHLDDALGPGSSDQEIAAVLRRLGSPADLAAEASAGAGVPDAAAPGTAPQGGGVQLRLRWPRLGWRRWAMIGAALALVGTAAGYWIAMATAPALQFGTSYAWWYPQDRSRAVDTQADGAQQTTIPIRSGQQQGYVVTVYNPSGWTQTVLGAAPDSGSAPGNPENALVSVATSDPNVFPPPNYALPESIPPYQSRAVRVMWVSTVCLEAGSAEGTDQLTLRVRVGWLTRTEVIQLPEGFYVSGPSQGPCT